jgi:23S rRNA (cytosine1962-C5)-methyltransferase
LNPRDRLTISSHALHPHTLKYLRQGHPWITKDRFSMSFNHSSQFIQGLDERGHESAILLHDPGHKEIKARLWRLGGGKLDFPSECRERLTRAYENREKMNLADERENYYLAFGEADFLPGLFIQRLGPVALVQTYCGFWERHRDLVSGHISELCGPSLKGIWWQERNTEKIPKVHSFGKPVAATSIREFDINYNLRFGAHYDVGLYSDMSFARKSLEHEFKCARRVLNLYCYTGAFSLFALKHGADKVVSVDLSEPYLKELWGNLTANPELKRDSHQSICAPVDRALNDLIKAGENFDLIICDPPSASSDGKKVSRAFDKYNEILVTMEKVLAKDGKIATFLNTHSVSRGKFKGKIEGIISEHGLPLQVETTLGLGEDCPTLKGYPEGDYLKGLLLKSTNS